MGHIAQVRPQVFKLEKTLKIAKKNIKDAVVLGWAGRFWKTRAKQWESQR